MFLKQRGKQFLLKECDQNTKFFHKFASGCKRNNQVQGLMDKHDEWKEGERDVQNIIVDYFSSLFKASTEINGLTDREQVCILSKEHYINLRRSVTSDEVKL